MSDAVVFSRAESTGGANLGLWTLDVARVDGEQFDSSVLDDDESRQAASEPPARRLRYLIAHVALRQFLGEHLGVRPEEITYFREPCPVCGGPQGRPAVLRPPRPVHFSHSGAGDVVAIAIASAPVGIDVEALPRPEAVSEVMGLLHPEERAELTAVATAERSLAFARLWTRKEAYLKGTGAGVAHGLAGEYLGVEGRAELPPGWSLRAVPVPPSYEASAALHSGPDHPGP